MRAGGAPLRLLIIASTLSTIWLVQDVLSTSAAKKNSRTGNSGGNRAQQAGQRRVQTQRNDHRNISELLNNLLRGYDNSVRPDFGGPPTIVDIDIEVRSMGPISEVDMTYSMDCYFRQSWIDRRLAFPSTTLGKDELALSISMLARIWKPDTFFENGKQSYLHTITSPNRFVRLDKNGRVLYSSRLTIKAGCPMNLEDFPMDTQRCPLKFRSFGYTMSDVIYRWNAKRQVVIASDMKLSQFDLVGNPTANSTYLVLPHTEYSMLLVSFHLKRHMGNFLIQVYGPCVLLVVLSWVSFWLNREATADRVSLGITTVLTMTFLGLEARTDLPKVPYPTALDFFVFLSFAFIFATILQFAMVHYFTKYGSGECYFNYELSDSDSEDSQTEDGLLELASSVRQMSACRSPQTPVSDRRRIGDFCRDSLQSSGRSVSFHQQCELSSPTSIVLVPLEASRGGFLGSSGSGLNQHQQRSGASTPGAGSSSRASERRRNNRRMPRYNSVSKIDRASRIIFPLFFLAINLFYWYSYLSRSKRIDYYDTDTGVV